MWDAEKGVPKTANNMSYHGPGGVVGGERTEFKYNEHISAQTNCRTLFPATRQVEGLDIPIFVSVPPPSWDVGYLAHAEVSLLRVVFFVSRKGQMSCISTRTPSVPLLPTILWSLTPVSRLVLYSRNDTLGKFKLPISAMDPCFLEELLLLNRGAIPFI